MKYRIPYRAIRSIFHIENYGEMTIHFYLQKNLVEFLEDNDIDLPVNISHHMVVTKVVITPPEHVPPIINSFHRETDRVIKTIKHDWRRKVKKPKKDLISYINDFVADRNLELMELMYKEVPLMFEMTEDQYTMMLLSI